MYQSFLFLRDENEIVTFVNNEVRLDVNVSPSEDTVWLSLADMCLLFGRDKSVISRHIKNVILENNLDVNQVVAKNATTGNDGKTYIVSFYNLDVIIPLGYKVHSQNGIMFRKWANSILKEYLLKGYIINENRTLITNENYVDLINKVDSIDKRLSVIEKTNLKKKKDSLMEKCLTQNQLHTYRKSVRIIGLFYLTEHQKGEASLNPSSPYIEKSFVWPIITLHLRPRT